MHAPTHATFSLVFVILAGTGLGLLLTPATAAFAILGALLPDIDTPMSWIGRLARPLAARLERASAIAPRPTPSSASPSPRSPSRP
jgi:hypothetical protein